MYFPSETLELSVYQRAYEEGTLVLKDGRYCFVLGDAWFPAARVVWNIMHPDDMAQPNEEIHHTREKDNDDPRYLVKLTTQQHKALHCVNLDNPIPDGMRERIGELLLLGYLSRKQIARIVSEEFDYKIGKRRVHSISRKKSTRTIMTQLVQARAA